MEIVSERPDNSLVKDLLSRILKGTQLLPGLTGWWWWGTQQRDIHHVPGKSWYLRICGCGAEGPQCGQLTC